MGKVIGSVQICHNLMGPLLTEMSLCSTRLYLKQYLEAEEREQWTQAAKDVGRILASWYLRSRGWRALKRSAAKNV